MNKWIKQGMAGLALTSLALTGYVVPKEDDDSSRIEITDATSVDAIDYAGGSKLKDRRIFNSAAEIEIAVVRALLDA